MIRRFGTYTPQQLEQMKQDLGIRMKSPKLTFCASYYRITEKRDPSIEELQFLDHFTNDSDFSPLSIAPTELFTNDAFVANTYADVMAKRHELMPDAKTPCTLSEMMHLASTYLERAGKDAAPSGLLCSVEKRRTPYTNLSGTTVSLTDSDFCLRILAKQPQPLCTGDLLLLLRPLSKHSVTDPDAPMEKLLTSPALTAQIKQMRRVGKRGLFAEVMSLTSCATVEPERLSETGEPIPLSMLVDAYEGDLLVRVSRESYPDFTKTAYEMGVRAAAFAMVTSGTRITVVRPEGLTFSLESRFLRSLFPLRPVSARLGNEHDAKQAPISHTPRAAMACKYLHTAVQKHARQTASVGSAVCTAASVAPTQGFFRNALDTALTTVLTLAAAGCDYPAQRLAISMEIPQNSTDPDVAGACISTLLGVYRLQAELALPAASIRLECDPSLAYPRLHTFALAHGNACPTGFTAAGNHVYCLAPATTADGIPDFDDLRRLLTCLASLRQKGILQSARVLCREAVTDGIRAMTDAHFGCLTPGNEVIAANVLPLGILIETTEEIAGTKIGTVTSRNGETAPAVEKILPTHEYLIPSDIPEVVLVSQRDDLDAAALVSILGANGADVSHLFAESQDAAALSRKLLTAKALILCGRVALPDTPHVRFALDTMKRAGGMILLLGNAEIAPLSHGIALPDGIYDKMIAQICEK